MNTSELMSQYLERIPCGDVFIIKKKQINSQKTNKNIRTFQNTDNGIAIRDFSDSLNAKLYYSSNINEKLDINIMCDCSIQMEVLPKFKKNTNENAIDIEDYEILEDINCKEIYNIIENQLSIKKVNVKNMILTAVDITYTLLNTNKVYGSGKINNFAISIYGEYKGEDKFISLISPISFKDSLSSLSDIQLDSEKTTKINYVNDNTSNITNVPIIISNVALYELMYMLLFFLSDYVIKSDMSPFYKVDFQKKNIYRLNNLITIVENSVKNKMVKGNIDFGGYGRVENEIIKNGKIEKPLGINGRNHQSSGSSYRSASNIIPHTKPMGIYIAETEKVDYLSVYSEYIIINSFQGLYESIQNETLDFECCLHTSNISSKGMTEVKTNRVQLNLLEVLNSIEGLDTSHTYMGDGGMLVPCAKLNNDFKKFFN